MAAINIKTISVGSLFIQSGNGIPTHIATKGTLFVDLDSAIEYINKNGSNSWSPIQDGAVAFQLTQDQYNAITGSTSPSSSNVFATMANLSGITVTGNTTIVQNGLNTYTGGTTFAPSINISAATLNYLSATTITGITYYSGSTQLSNIIDDKVPFTGTNRNVDLGLFSISASTSTFKPSNDISKPYAIKLIDDGSGVANPDLIIESVFNQRLLLSNLNTGATNTWYLHTQSFGGGYGLNNFGIGTSSNNTNNFFTISTGGTVTITNGSNPLVYNNGKVGLGLSNPQYDLDITKSASTVSLNVKNTNPNGFSYIETLGDNGTTYASLNTFNSSGGVGTFYDNNSAGVATNSLLSFLVNENVSGGWVMTAGGFGTSNERFRVTTGATSFRSNTVSINNDSISGFSVNDISGTIPVFRVDSLNNLISLQGNQIKNLAAGTGATDAINLSQLTGYTSTGITLTNTQIGFGSTNNTLTGSNLFTYVPSGVSISLSATSVNTFIGQHFGSSFANAIYILGSATTRTANNYVLRGDQTNVELNSPNAAGYVGFMNGAGSPALIVRSTGATAHQIFTIRRSQNSFVTNLNIDSGSGNTSVFQVNTDHTNSHSIIDARNNFNLLFQTNDVTRAALLNNGNLIIGDTANTTNQRLVRINQDSSSIDIGSNSTNPTQAGIWFNQTTPSGGNAALLGIGSSTTYLQATSGVEIRPGGSTTFLLRPFAGSGAITNYQWDRPNNLNQTSGTEISGWKYNGGLRGWVGGNITTQRELWWGPTTFTASSATIITNPYGMFIEQPLTGTNVTFTNPFALGLIGNLHFSGNNSVIVMNDSTGTKRDVLSFAADNVRIAGIPGSSDIYLNVTTANSGVILKSNGNIGIRNGTPTATLHLPSGSTSSSSSPLKFTTGSLMTTPESGATEWNGSNLFVTNNSNVRNQIAYISDLTGSTTLPSTQIAFGSTANTITSSVDLSYSANVLTLGGSIQTVGNRYIGSSNNAFSIRSNNLPRLVFAINGDATFSNVVSGIPATGGTNFVTYSQITGFTSGGTSSLKTKSGEVLFSSFTGTQLSYQVIFSTPFSDALYSPSIIGEDLRSWSYSGKTANGFTINTNSNIPLTANVSWTAIKHGEN